jgi:endonuclease/exonuclease/phosphatase family metal-dependent hydrolase
LNNLVVDHNGSGSLTISSLRLDEKANLSKTMMTENSNYPSRRLARVFGALLLAALLPGSAAATPLRVVTYNIHGGNGNLVGNLTTFRDTMLSGEDVLCLQEVPVGGDWNTVKTVFPEYPHTFQAVNTTTKWIWPWESHQQTSVAILSKHPFQFTHSQLIQIDPGGDKWERHAQHVRIDPGAGPVDVFNFHNTYNWFENDYEYEQAGLAKFRDYVSGRLGVATPADAGRLVMAGDFNLRANKVAAIVPTPSHVGNGLDHVCSVLTFTSQGVYGTYGAGLSDHNAVWAVANAGSSACDMLSFTIDGMTGIIDGTDVTVTVPFGTDVTTLDPTFTLSPGATADPPSGTTRNFTTSQSYTITAQDGLTTRTYTAAVHKANPVTNGYALWAAQYDLSGTNALPAANPDGDELNNLGEYALGGSPTNANDAAIMPVCRIVNNSGADWFEYVYRRRLNSTLSYSLETTTNLTQGVWSLPADSLVTSGMLDALFASVTNWCPMESIHRFFRLSIESQ